MAALSNAERRVLWASFMEELSIGREALPLTKPELRAVVNAIDGWLDANAGSLNSAIVAAGGGALAVKQRVRLAVYVLRSRYNVS